MWETFLFYFVSQIEKTTQLVGSGYMVILHGSFSFNFSKEVQDKNSPDNLVNWSQEILVGCGLNFIIHINSYAICKLITKY